MSDEEAIGDAIVVPGSEGSESEIDWYFASKSGAVEGPFEPGELRVLYESRKLDDSTFVWNSSSAKVHRDWLPISKIKHLYTYIFTRQVGDVQNQGSASESSLYEMAKDHNKSSNRSMDNKEDEFRKGTSRKKTVVENDIEKAVNKALPTPKSRTIPSKNANPTNLDSVMDQLEAMQAEMKMQNKTLKNMDVMLNLKPKDSSSEMDSSSSGDDESSTSGLIFTGQRTASTNPDANVSRFTLQEAWDEKGEVIDPGRFQTASSKEDGQARKQYTSRVDSKQEVAKKKEETEKLSLLLSGNKLRKLNIPAMLRLSEVRKIVGKVEKVSPNLIELVHKGQLLTNNEAKLPEFNVRNGDTLVVRVISRLDQHKKPWEHMSKKPNVTAKTEKLVEVETTKKVIKPEPTVQPLSEEDIVLETYPPQKRAIIREMVKAGFPQDSVIVALEITKFNKNYAMEWLLSDEIREHKKYEFQRESKIHKVDYLPAVAERSIAVDAGNKVTDEEKVHGTWGCPTCTFTNLEIMSYCEMCGLKKNSKAPPKFSKSRDLPPAFVVNQERDSQIEEKAIEAARKGKRRTSRRTSRTKIKQKKRKKIEYIPPAPPVQHQRNSSKNLIGSDRGNLKVTLIAAVGLVHKASYCLITLGRLTKKTKPVKKSKTLEFDQVFFFNGFKPDSSRNLRVALMKEKKVRADKVIGQVSYALPLTFNSLSHDCIELTDQKNQTAGLLIISAVILQHGSKV